MDNLDDYLIRGDDEEDENPIGVPESLVNLSPSLEVKYWYGGHVDNSSAISRDLLAEVSMKCCPLRMRVTDETCRMKIGSGHGGFIRHGLLQDGPGGKTPVSYSVYPITAKHNLRTVIDNHQHLTPDGNPEFRVGDHPVIIHFQDVGFIPAPSEILNLREGLEASPAISYFGFDVSIGSLKENSDFIGCSPKRSFGLARKELVLQPGMKVGMAVTFTEETKPPDEPDEKTRKRIFGEPNRVNVYTGEIVHVGKSHIEYTINSFTSCSGAIVFLLDKNQPDAVQECDYGKAVAVHTEGHPTAEKRNYGFLINVHPQFGS